MPLGYARMSRRQQVLIETHALRQQAMDLLAALEQAHKDVVQQLQSEQREDMVRIVSGRSALEAAAAETRRVIDALDRAVEEVRNTAADTDVSEDTMREVVHVVGRIGALWSTSGTPRAVVGR